VGGRARASRRTGSALGSVQEPREGHAPALEKLIDATGSPCRELAQKDGQADRIDDEGFVFEVGLPELNALMGVLW
jgi:hypothetical protein